MRLCVCVDIEISENCIIVYIEFWICLGLDCIGIEKLYIELN